MNQQIEPNTTVGEIVKNNYQTAEVLKKYNIDFCCGGKNTIGEVCSTNNISIDELTKALVGKMDESSSSNAQNFKDWEPGFLANYIVNVHHKYVKENMPILLEYTQKIANVHGARHSELMQVASLFKDVAADFTNHMMKEENILFPYISSLHAASKNKSQVTPSHFGTVKNPIRMMEMEHENVGSLLKQMRQITSDYHLPSDACNTYNVTFKKLDEFENDLHQHIHLENNILFPGAIELEDQLNGSN